MSIKPILFNTEMVSAILGGRKTQTRRLMKPQPLFYTGRKYIFADEEIPKKWEGCQDIVATYQYQPGDILWVRETWSTHYDGIHDDLQFCYKADGIDLQAECMWGESNRWYPSIHMPRDAARIFLLVNGVRIERLNDISQSDAIDEGALTCDLCETNEYKEAYEKSKREGLKPPIGYSPRERFAALWDSTIKKSDISRFGWDANPWVWVIEFERYEKPEGWY